MEHPRSGSRRVARSSTSLISSSAHTMMGSAGCSRPLNWRMRKIPRQPRRNSSKTATSRAFEFLCGDFRFEIDLVAGKTLAQFARLIEFLHDRHERIGHWQNDLSFRPEQSNVLTDDRLNQW